MSKMEDFAGYLEVVSDVEIREDTCVWWTRPCSAICGLARCSSAASGQHVTPAQTRLSISPRFATQLSVQPCSDSMQSLLAVGVASHIAKVAVWWWGTQRGETRCLGLGIRPQGYIQTCTLRVVTFAVACWLLPQLSRYQTPKRSMAAEPVRTT